MIKRFDVKCVQLAQQSKNMRSSVHYYVTFFNASSHSTSVSIISISAAARGTIASLGQLMSTSLLIKFGLKVYVRFILFIILTISKDLVERDKIERVFVYLCVFMCLCMLVFEYCLWRELSHINTYVPPRRPCSSGKLTQKFESLQVAGQSGRVHRVKIIHDTFLFAKNRNENTN